MVLVAIQALLGQGDVHTRRAHGGQARDGARKLTLDGARSIALLGLVIGFGMAARLPVVYQASTSLLVTPMSTGGEDSGAPITNEQTIAGSRTVAELAVRKLGLQESADSFLGSYSAKPVTERVMTITASAPSSDQAVLRANAVASPPTRQAVIPPTESA